MKVFNKYVCLLFLVGPALSNSWGGGHPPVSSWDCEREFLGAYGEVNRAHCLPNSPRSIACFSDERVHCRNQASDQSIVMEERHYYGCARRVSECRLSPGLYPKSKMVVVAKPSDVPTHIYWSLDGFYCTKFGVTRSVRPAEPRCPTQAPKGCFEVCWEYCGSELLAGSEIDFIRFTGVCVSSEADCRVEGMPLVEFDDRFSETLKN